MSAVAKRCFERLIFYRREMIAIVVVGWVSIVRGGLTPEECDVGCVVGGFEFESRCTSSGFLLAEIAHLKECVVLIIRLIYKHLSPPE
jgi:hypothetical protein